MPMQKYKRPQKQKGVKSIPLRNPRKVDMYRFDVHTGKMFRLYNPPSEGASAESFANSKVKQVAPPEPEPKYVIIKQREVYLEYRLYFHNRKFWITQLNYSAKTQYLTRKYDTRGDALGDLETNSPNMWIVSKPL